MTTELSEFSDPAFDATGWINASCRDRQSEEPLDKYLAELEMRLQLTAEEIESVLQDHSATALRRIPFAVQEVYRLQGDIQGMQDNVGMLSTSVSREAGAAAESVSTLSSLDQVKRNMQAAVSTLTEATQLSGMFVKVEEVFTSGDLPLVASILSAMRNSLTKVGDVPEFRAGRQRLRALEDRLQALIEGSLGEAFAASASGGGGVTHSGGGLDGGGAGGGGGDHEGSVMKLCALLLAVDRAGTVESLYCNTRLAVLHAMWEEAAAAAAAAGGAAAGNRAEGLAWLPTFYAALLAYLAEETRYLGRVLPAMAAQLLGTLALQLLTKVRVCTCCGFVHALPASQEAAARGVSHPHAAASSMPSQRHKKQLPGACPTHLRTARRSPLSKATHERLAPTTSIPLLTSLMREVAAFGRALNALLPPAVGRDQRDSILHRLYAPLEEKVASYATLESAHLSSELAAAISIALFHAGDDTEEVVRGLTGALRGLFGCMRVSLERCMSFTEGSELRVLLRTMDTQLSSSLATLQASVSTLHSRFRPSPHNASPSGGNNPHASPQQSHPGSSSSSSSSTPHASGTASSDPEPRQDPAVAEADELGHLEATLRTTISTAVPKLQALCDPSQPLGPGPVAHRLSSHPATLATLAALAHSVASDTRFMALPQATTAVDQWRGVAAEAVLDVLLSQVRWQLRLFPTLPDWRRELGPASLPSFSASPLPYVTALGEYLLTLPQQLEVLLGDSEEEDEEAEAGGEGGKGASGGTADGGVATDDGEELAASWLDKVVTHAASLYSDATLALPRLSPAGGSQLAADVEYFCNVCTALHVEPPLSLLTLQLFAGQPADEFAYAARAALAEEGVDVAALHAVAAMRHLSLDA
ncbi:MAG: hypothetical protein WDW38_006880 [Sanguina aurantia]